MGFVEVENQIHVRGKKHNLLMTIFEQLKEENEVM